MGWMNGGFLWFAAGASIPIIIHLLHRQKYKKVRWAAMDWLLAAIRKTRRRLQFENLILLLIRMAVMTLIAFALARPYISRATASIGGESDTHYIFAIDTSYSMDYKRGQGKLSSLDLAKKASQDLIATLQPSEKDRFTVLAASEHPETPLQPGWNELGQVKKAIEDLRVRPYGSDLLQTMLEIERLLDRDAPSNPKNADRRVYLITDLQRTGWEFADRGPADRLRDVLKRLSQRSDTWFHLIDVGTADAPNHAIVGVRVSNKILTVKRPAEVLVEVYNFSTRAAEGKRVQLLVDGQVFETRPILLLPGIVTTIPFLYPFGSRDAGPHVFEARFDPQDEKYDYPAIDNHRTLAVEVKEAVRVLLIDGEPKDGHFVNRETGTMERVLRTSGIFQTIWVPSHSIDEQRLEEFDFVALCNVRSLRPDIVTKLEEFVARGGGLFVSLGEQVDTGWYNENLARCNGELNEETGGGWRCRKCGLLAAEEEMVTLRKTDSSTNPEVAVRLHGKGRGLLPIRLGKKVGTPPDAHQIGVDRRPSKVDLDHEIFSLYKYSAQAQPYKVVFWKYFELEYQIARHRADGGTRVLMELDDSARSQLMVEGRWREGRVVLLATAIDGDPDWNQGFPGLAPYFIMVKNLGEYLSARSSTALNFHIGEPLRYFVPYDLRNKFHLYTPAQPSVQKPDAITAERRSEQDRFMEILYAPDLSLHATAGRSPKRGLKTPGGYILRRVPSEGGDPLPRCGSCGTRAGEFARLCSQCGKGVVPEIVAAFGVNVGPRDTRADSLRFCEGNLETLTPARLRERYPEFAVEFLGEKNEKGEGVRIDPPKSELWRQLLFALLGFLLIESLLAALFGRSKQ